MSVIFEQLRISDKGTRMHIDVHVNKSELFKNVYLDSLTIMTADKVPETYPDVPTEDYIYRIDFKPCVKCAHLVLNLESFNTAAINWNELEQIPICADKPYARLPFNKSNLSTDLFFVYVKIKGMPDQCTPCRLDEEITLGATFDEHLLYQRVLDYIKGLADTCEVPTGFTDFILLWNAFKAAIETEHYIPAIKYYNMLFGNWHALPSRDGSHSPFGGMGYNNDKPKPPCNCHG